MEIINYLITPTSLKLGIAGLMGLVIGVERELAGKDPGLRTFTLISLGSCIFTMLSMSSAYGVPNAEPSRIAAQIIPGIGFLGAGTIFRSRQRVSGLTTAALMWVTAGIGMSVGFERYDVALSSTLITLILLYLLRMIHRLVGNGDLESEDVEN